MKVVALAGGTGGAKLAEGLQAALPRGDLTVIANTGDDTERHGLLVMPDHDALLYMLGGRFDFERGWGVVDESWAVMDGLARYGEDDWFRLGDRDLATHIARSARLGRGASLSEAVLGMQAALGLPTWILPMSDAPVRTKVRTADGWLDFQEYFVRLRQGPEVLEIRVEGDRTPTPAVVAALEATDLVVLGPSNPMVSIGPIVDGPIGDLVRGRRGRVPVVAVSPIIGGHALKGPADRMLVSLGHESSALGVARIYAELATDFVLDRVDEGLAPAIDALGLRTHVMDTLMAGGEGRARLAREILSVAGALAS